MLDNASPFRTRCPELHKLIAQVDEQLSKKASLAQLHAWMRQYLVDVDAAKTSEIERQARRRRHLLIESFKPGNKHWRDGTARIEGCLFEHYDSDSERDLESVYPKGVPAKIKSANYYVRQPDNRGNGQFTRTGIPCYVPGDKHRGERVMVCAWTPIELAPRDADQRSLPQAPLPPRNLGRDYTLPEIAWGLVALHDADGGFTSFIPKDHPLFGIQWLLDVAALTGSISAFDSDHAADDTWLLSLLPLWKRFEAELTVEIDSTEAKRDKRPRRNKTEYKIVQREAKLAAEWKRAHEAGTRKPEFAKEHGMTQAKLDELLDRVYQRKRRSDN